MDGVRVLDESGKVLYVFNTIGDTVSVGRDKKKCGIVLPINAQGVSRVHGSFKWTNENELSFSDSSTYGTSVNGTLVKDRSETVRDGAHIFVGDVELIVSFPAEHLTLHSTSSDEIISYKQGAATKRKSIATDGSQKESKRSKLNPNLNRSAPRQSQISSFLVKKPIVIEEEDDNDCAILAEDTPLSQNMDSVRSTTRNMVSFVKDSVGLSSGLPATRFSQKPDNTTSSNVQTSLRSTARRKKQCIFDVNIRPPVSRTAIVLAEDTQPETAALKLAQDRSLRNTSRKVNNVTTCIPDTCDQNAPMGNSPYYKTSTLLAHDDSAATVCTSTFAPKTPLTAVQTSRSSDTPSVTQLNSKPARAKGTSIVDSNPVKNLQRPVEIIDGFSDDELAELIVDPDEDAITQGASRSGQKTSASVIRAGSVSSSSVSNKSSKRASAKKTSIFDAIPSKKKPMEAMDSVFDEVDSTLMTRCSSTFGHTISASPILNCRSSRMSDTSTASSRNTRRGKKANVFEKNPVIEQEPRAKIVESIPDEELNEPVEQPDVKDILKLVSTGKRYENGDDEADAEDTKGLEIERVVARLGELVHYVDLERPPKPVVVKATRSEVSSSKSSNFKRFKKASQGRFNSSLSSANISCVIGGSEDLVDFRQLPQVA